ncbi:MAG: hypothetical protein AAF764_01355 [Pseudomonadota bacterium]
MPTETFQIVTLGILTVAVPFIVMCLRGQREKNAVRVTAVESVETEGGVQHYPTFTVVAGEHKGHSYRSVWTCDKDAARNEIAAANLDIETGEIFSDDRDWTQWSVWFVPFKLYVLFLLVEFWT